MSQLPPELFTPPSRPPRIDSGRVPSYRARRFLTILIILILVAGGVWRWVLGSPSLTMMRTGQIPTIKAEGIWKQKPEQPGGIDIPHQDIQVYEALDAKDTAKPQVEHLLPPPEVPQQQTPPPVVVTTRSPVPAPQAENLAPAKSADQVPVIDVPTATLPSILTTVTPQKTTVTKPTSSAPTPAAAPLVEAPPPPMAQPAKPVPAPVVATPAAAPAVIQHAKNKTVVAANIPVASKKENPSQPHRVVQFASVQSESAAKDMMNKMQSRYASILGDDQLRVVQADLGAKGIYFRIQSAPMPEDQAGKICAAVKKLKEGCILVHP